MVDAGLSPDFWQSDLMRATDPRALLLAGRQCGKSAAVSCLSVWTAVVRPGSLILLLSPSLRQSGELFRDKVLKVYNALGRPVPAVRETALTLELANNSRIISLPGEEGTIRGYSGIALAIVDEAARVPDDLYLAVRPMLAVSKGRLVCLSTPAGKRGWFYEEWVGSNPWRRYRVPADQCPRISREFLAQERQRGERYFRQEYCCSYEDVTDAVFDTELVHSAVSPDVPPLRLDHLLRG